MGLFTRKYDLYKDCLRMEFDLQSKKYVFYLYHEQIPYNLLNRKTKKYLDEQNNELNINNDLMEQKVKQAEINRRYDKLKSLGYSCNSFEVLTENKGTMSSQMETYLNNLLAEKDVLLGIHRVGDRISQEQIEDILINGLIITGHLGGAATNDKNLNRNVSYYADNSTIVKELMYANAYKNSVGSILIRIPDQDLTKNIFITDEFGATRLNPKYILGYVPLEENHHIETIISPDQVMKKKNSSNSTDIDILQLYEQIYPTEEIVEEKNRTL